MDAEQEIRPEAEQPLTGVATFANRIGARNLLIIIVTMPLVFLIVVMAVISVAGRPGGKEEAAASGAAQPAPAAYAEILEQPAQRPALSATPASLFTGDPAPLILPKGADVGAMALDGDRLALRIEVGEKGEIVVYDLARGAVIQRIPVTETGEEDL